MFLEHASNQVAMRAGDPYAAVLATHLETWAERERLALLHGATRLPAETFEELRSSRVLSYPVPEPLGGLGASLLASVSAIRTIASSAPSTALCIAMPLANAANARVSDEAVPAAQRSALAQGRRWIAEQAGQGKALAVAISEPGAHGELANTRTRAVLGGAGELLLTGDKSFATLGADADFFLCSAR